MERFEKTTYIIRFSERNEIKTLKIEDKETLDYIVNKLEYEDKQYIVIKQVENHSKIDLQWLLDCEKVV